MPNYVTQRSKETTHLLLLQGTCVVLLIIYFSSPTVSLPSSFLVPTASQYSRSLLKKLSITWFMVLPYLEL
ncbi:hypothetical protein FRX31_002603 [Thalictrum thalictroides]|uniref:Uncharacterized protein n=1 Tax=Thalictrum thalictroides TaxID=46969 RepID=A0A7J6XGP9_THATH|nr:hypothetical protein FRX31_002603 [Thalictrum thalictroides]